MARALWLTVVLLAACDAEPERLQTLCLQTKTEVELVQECSGVNTGGIGLGAGCYMVPRPVARCLKAKVEVNPEWVAWKKRSTAAN